jgi:rhodanese-related sulfurtransferase
MSHSPRFEKLCEEARTKVKEVSADEVARRLEARAAGKDAFELVDVREESEVAGGRIRGAKAMGRGVLERDVEKAIPDSGTEVILYCGGGFRSALAAESLAKMGYTNVSSMAGGWRAWKELALPTE